MNMIFLKCGYTIKSCDLIIWNFKSIKFFVLKECMQKNNEDVSIKGGLYVYGCVCVCV